MGNRQTAYIKLDCGIRSKNAVEIGTTDRDIASTINLCID